MEYAIQTLKEQLDLVLEDLNWTFEDDDEQKELEDRRDELKKAIAILTKNGTNA
jgi:hypothetical protein